MRISKKSIICIFGLILILCLMVSTGISVKAEELDNEPVVETSPGIQWQQIWEDKIMPAIITFVTSGGASAIVCGLIMKSGNKRTANTELIVTTGTEHSKGLSEQNKLIMEGMLKLKESDIDYEHKLDELNSDILSLDSKVAAFLDMANIVWGNSSLSVDTKEQLTNIYQAGKNTSIKAMAEVENLISTLKSKTDEITKQASETVVALEEKLTPKFKQKVTRG